MSQGGDNFGVKKMNPMRARALVEATYRFDLSDSDCAMEMAFAVEGVFAKLRPGYVFNVEHRAGKFGLASTISPDHGLAERSMRVAGAIPHDKWRLLADGGPTLTTSTEALGRALSQRLERSGALEFTGLVCPTGVGIVGVGATSGTPEPVTARLVRDWNPVAQHIRAAWRLRASLRSSENDSLVVFSVDGKIVENRAALSNGPVLALLRKVVLERESQRCRTGAGYLWPAVVAGEWTLIDKFDHCGRRWVIAHRNSSAAELQLGLSARERYALTSAMEGTSNKAIALNLEVSEATACRLVGSALKRLGLERVSEAIELRNMKASRVSVGNSSVSSEVGVLSTPVSRHNAEDHWRCRRLTIAERAVLDCVVQGHSHRHIATLRGTSPRTVANQVAAIYRKLGVQSRRELVANALASISEQGEPLRQRSA